ncbi:hypothetical protein JTB14_029930 [Gonioctena quinquepunctata]|nr:hypothetical protein JTB14_029930 [Gonioctena quinquepunctata]
MCCKLNWLVTERPSDIFTSQTFLWTTAKYESFTVDVSDENRMKKTAQQKIGKIRPKRGSTEKELLEELQKGLSDIEGVSSDDSDNEEEIQVRQIIGQMIDDVSEHLNEKNNEEEIEDDGEEQSEEDCSYDDFIT